MKRFSFSTIITSMLLMSCNPTAPTSTVPEGWLAEVKVGTINVNAVQNAGLSVATVQGMLQSRQASNVPGQTALRTDAFVAFLNFSVGGKAIGSEATLTYKTNNSVLKMNAGDRWTTGALLSPALKNGQKLSFELAHQGKSMTLEASLDTSQLLPVPMVQKVKLEPGKLDVQWSAVNGARQYRVLIDQDSDPLNGQLLDSGALSGTQWTQNLTAPLAEGGVYHVTVLASNLEPRVRTEPYSPAPVPRLSAAAVKTTVQKPVVPGSLVFYTPSLSLKAIAGSQAIGTLQIQSGATGLDATLTTLPSSTAQVTHNAPAFTLAPNSTRTVNVTALCPATPVTQTATLRLTTNDPGTPTVDLPITLVCEPQLQSQSLWQRTVALGAESGAWSPAGQHLATLYGQELALLDDTFKTLYRGEPFQETLENVNWLDDQTLVLTTPTKIHLWDTVKKQSLTSWNNSIFGLMSSIVPLKSRNWVMLTGQNHAELSDPWTRIYTLQGDLIRDLPNLSDAAFSPDGQTLVGWQWTTVYETMERRSELVFYSVPDLKQLRKVTLKDPVTGEDRLAHGQEVVLGWSLDSSKVHVMVTPHPKNSSLFNVQASTGSQQAIPLDFAALFQGFKVDASGQLLTLTDKMALARLNPTTGMASIKKLPIPTKGFALAAFHPNGNQMALMSDGAGCENRETLLTDLDLKVLNVRGSWYCQESVRLAFNNTGDVIQYAGQKLQLFDRLTGQLKAHTLFETFQGAGETRGIPTIAHHNGTDWAVLRYPDQSVDVVQVSTGVVKAIVGAGESGEHIRLSPQGTHLMVLSSDGATMRVFEVSTAQLKRELTLSALGDMFRDPVWLDNQRLVYTHGSAIKMLDVASGQVTELEDFVHWTDWVSVGKGQVMFVEFEHVYQIHPDTKQLTGVKLKYRMTPAGSPSRVFPTGSHLALVESGVSGSSNTYLSVFDLNTGEELRQIKEARSRILGLDTYRQDGKLYVALRVDHAGVEVIEVK